MEAPSRRFLVVVAGLAGVAAVFGALAWLAIRTGPERSAIQTYTRLLFAAESQNLETARSLCSRRFLREHGLGLADEGGIQGLPRSIHKNFRAWRQGPAVWFCPTNRIGPVYQFVFEDGGWKYDGPVGLLRSDGELLPIPPDHPA